MKCWLCDSENIMWIEMSGDYDWVLMIKCRDCNKYCHRFLNIEVDENKNAEAFWLTYFFFKWNLVAYSLYPAKWLKIEDDLTLDINQLWGTNTKWDISKFFKPLKQLSKSHIKSIIRDQKSWKIHIKNKYLSILWDILNKKENGE